MKVYELKENKRPKIKPGVCIGKLTVIETTPERKNGYMVWRCDCECGGSICLDTRTLQRGTIRDCGCETVVKPGQRDITGQRFGQLVALYPTGGQGRDGSLIWHCRCAAASTHRRLSEKLRMPEQTAPEGLCWKAVRKACGAEVCR